MPAPRPSLLRIALVGRRGDGDALRREDASASEGGGVESGVSQKM